MPNKDCEICGNNFYAKPSHIKDGHGKYCSRKCHHIGLLSGKFVKCFLCRVEVYRSKTKLKRSKSKKYFCSKSCQTIWRNKKYSGKNHSKWKGGDTMYRKIMKNKNVTQICTLCKLDDKRVLVVHHIDKNRKNARPSNLTWLCHNCHHLVHCGRLTMHELMATLV